MRARPHETHKSVYAPASHSHFVMDNIYADAPHPGSDDFARLDYRQPGPAR